MTIAGVGHVAFSPYQGHSTHLRACYRAPCRLRGCEADPSTCFLHIASLVSSVKGIDALRGLMSDASSLTTSHWQMGMNLYRAQVRHRLTKPRVACHLIHSYGVSSPKRSQNCCHMRLR